MQTYSNAPQNRAEKEFITSLIIGVYCMFLSPDVAVFSTQLFGVLGSGAGDLSRMPPS